MALPQPSKRRKKTMDLAKLTGGSGIIKYRGLELESKDGITVVPELDTMDIPIDGISEAADQRTNAHKFSIKVTPSGKWTNPDRLFPYLNYPAGRLVLPVLPVSAINTATDVLTVTNHQLYTGDRVAIGVRAGGTLPTASPAVDETTLAFVRVASVDTFTLHSTRAGALADTGKLDFSDDGDSVVIVGQFDLEILGEDGDAFTFHAVALAGHPDLKKSRSETPFGEVEFMAFLRHAYRVEDDNAFYTKSSPGWTGWTAAASDIKTQSPWVAWANQLKVATVDTTDNELDFGSAHGLTTGDVVYVGSTGTLPGATPTLDPERKYYAKVVDSDTISLHLTAADAGTGDNEVNLTSSGTGTMFITIDNPPYTLMETESGVEVTSDVKLEDRETDRDGVINAKFVSCTMEAKFIALSLAAQNVLGMLKLQGTGAELGRSLNTGSRPLNIFSAGMFVRLNGAAPKAGELAWNMKDDRARELTMVSTRVVSAGALAPVGVVGTEIP
jgi:hypothetical protein